MLFIDINLCRLEDDECIQDINEQKIQERHFSFLSKEPRYPGLFIDAKYFFFAYTHIVSVPSLLYGQI